jgi:hypothetical protein
VIYNIKKIIGLWAWKETDKIVAIFWDASHTVLRVFMLFDQVRNQAFVFTRHPGKRNR